MQTPNVVVEVTAHNYSIKLSSNKFDLPTMKEILTQLTSGLSNSDKSDHLEDDDLKSREMSFDEENFDRLCDK